MSAMSLARANLQLDLLTASDDEQKAFGHTLFRKLYESLQGRRLPGSFFSPYHCHSTIHSKKYNKIRHKMKSSSPACHQFWILALCPCLFSLPAVQLRPKRLVHQTWLQWLMLKALDALERVILHQVNCASRPPNPQSDPYCCSWNTLSTTLSSSIFQSSKMQYGLF
jgi:hypothetical protein